MIELANGEVKVEVKDGWKLIESTDTARLMWDAVLALEFPLLADMAARLFHMHPTSCSVERMWSVLRNVARDDRCRMGVDKTEKLIFIMAQEHLAQEAADAPPSTPCEFWGFLPIFLLFFGHIDRLIGWINVSPLATYISTYIETYI